eukprot:scaffold444485_cov25-Prasinocladus_malaysianus.AAC.1
MVLIYNAVPQVTKNIDEVAPSGRLEDICQELPEAFPGLASLDLTYAGGPLTQPQLGLIAESYGHSLTR